MTSRCYWTQARVLIAIGAWATHHGRAPTANEWVRGTLAHPDQRTVRQRFGTWNDALQAAGFSRRAWPNPTGRRRAA